MKLKAQGTIEYLVLIAIIVVIGLVIAGLSTNFFDSVEETNFTSNEVDLKTGTIQLSDYSQSIDGNLYLELASNDPNGLTITNIKINDSNQDFNSNNSLTLGKKILFSVPTHCLEGETITQKITISYETKDGLTKNETKTITTKCENTSINENTTQAGQGTTTQIGTEITTDIENPIITFNELNSNENKITINFTATDNNAIQKFDINYTGTNFIEINPTNNNDNNYTYELTDLNYDSTYNICIKVTDYNNNNTINCDSILTNPIILQLHTGQTNCYNSIESWEEVNCSSEHYGQDAYEDGNAKSFRQINSDIIQDNLTGLYLATGKTTIDLNYTDSINYCQNLEIGNYTNWRLPNIVELFSILDQNFNEIIFDEKPYINSSTTHQTNMFVLRNYYKPYYYEKMYAVEKRNQSSTSSNKILCVHEQTNTQSPLNYTTKNFLENENTITDLNTGLIWTKEINYLGNDANWFSALDYCENLELENYDWRVPNILELMTIFDYSLETEEKIPDEFIYSEGYNQYYIYSNTTIKGNIGSMYEIKNDGEVRGIYELGSKSGPSNILCVKK